jgi:hypothetical protein
MTREFQRATFHRSTLVRILSDTHPQLPDPKYDFGERLGRWLDLSDAMTLFSVLGAEAGGRTAAPSSDGDLPGQLARLRQTLSTAIHHDGVFVSAPEGTKPRIPFPTPTPAADDTDHADSKPDFTPFHRYYLAHQREMNTAITALRADARKALAAQSGAGRQLANLDAAFEKALAAREYNLLANVPILLARSFEQRYAEHRAKADDGDDPALWTQPGSWLETFCNDTKRALLAELELRLKPVAGLIDGFIAALNDMNETKPHE